MAECQGGELYNAAFAENVRKFRQGPKTSRYRIGLGSLRQKRNGNIDNNVKSLSPALELYFSKALSPSSTLSFDIIGTTYKNNQAATSMENSDNAQGGYEDNMLLDIRKHSFTGEINYDWEKDSHHLNFGYRGMAQWLNNTHHGNGEDYMTTVNTSAHRIFGEYSSRINDFSYRLSLGATGNIRHGGAEGFKDIAFTPMVLLGYKLKSNHFLRLKLTSATNMPNIQQMSANRIMIMEGFYKSGNEHVRNSVDYGTQFMYIFRFKEKLYLTADVHYNHTLRPLYNDYIAHDRYWNLQAMNGYHSSEAGSNISVSYSPWEFVSLDIEAAAEYQTFKKDAESAAYHNWFFPVYANLTFLWKGFTLQYRHTFGGAFLNGIYLEGLEKISYINLSYAHKNLRVGIQCLFPFVDDRFSNRTNALSAIVHNTSSNLRTKNHEFGVTLSWNFIKGKLKYADKTIYNDDYDSGAFEL